ncbi:hypothetical protein ASG49_00215 [Marmoricola sp. Leaf446]|uniref:cupin domain-containing protein n=1 Tax=Marmoricola sp. Leaf446 TaxID=1736379 RepID=UPI0006F75817|nr:cupin domain-containing protein [Marmoricola sp. Leaf446]KQT93488.1 hypothetical protein ASG49_00215 [Marmoricola sp. Leaf446]
MAGKYDDVRVRRVVAGLAENGRSTIVSDGFTETRLVTDAFVLNQIWQVPNCPPNVDDENTLGSEAVIPPPPNGFTHVLATFPPDSSWAYGSGGYEASMAAAGAADGYVEDGTDPGMHQTDSVDIITIVSGECVVILEEAETVLRAGDTFIQRGTKHAWRVSGDEPCVHSTLMVGARRATAPGS